MRKSVLKAGCILSILVCLVTIYPVYLIAMDFEDESQGQIFSDFYTFDPKHLFSDYEKGQRNLFSVIPFDDVNDETLESSQEYPQSKWKQQDYLDTLGIFDEIVFHKSFTKKIRGAIFSIPDCNQISLGPQSAVIFTANVSSLRATEYSYHVDLMNGSIYWRGYSYDPIISWPISSLDLSKNKITVEQALQIAEEQGGMQIRNVNHNQCNIDISISSNSHARNWVVTYNSTIDQFTSLLSMEIDANSGRHKIIAKGGAGYYEFDPQQINNSISSGKTDIFRAQNQNFENDVNLPPVVWTQADYYQIAKAFNKLILNEELDNWKIHSINFDLDCNDISFGPQQMDFVFWRLNILNGTYDKQDIIIKPRTGILQWNNEYDYKVNRFTLIKWNAEIINQSWIKIPADQAIKITYETEGKYLHQALENSGKRCEMNGWLMNFAGSEDSNSLEWNIGEWKKDYQALGEEPAQLTAFVNVKTGALRYFKFYGNLKQ